jgi:hypothetical protein
MDTVKVIWFQLYWWRKTSEALASFKLTTKPFQYIVC